MGKIRQRLRSARRHELAADNSVYREKVSLRDGMNRYPDEELRGPNGHYARTAATVRTLVEYVQRKRKEAA